MTIRRRILQGSLAFLHCVIHSPALKYVYMLEFHSSLGLASRIYEALQNAFKVPLCSSCNSKLEVKIISNECQNCQHFANL